jgi:predicted nucleic acid-binding protein
MIYLDANVIIRLLEGDSASRSGLEAILDPFRNKAGSLATSRLSLLECKVRPLR